ncbi:ABC transporter ATP-binding protein [Actinobacteria bacterium YIM 96077]|uniref:ABC transporter ATP-binding protein n=1 Tax=Phytoactinopolyspora halophila TaxID=1981511 RepID=A0A329QHH6_9ACTN|nr:ABC transporter ATP-binding protein [Phytoactinopolyspora halophila]AYY14438.1 ABC transporter ATP-binding protein [Actinobacteria bacterium YIM 96077]RAW11431.1 ABC transporter ATP-binding protein [Phytoactinopolyspora halophila]
MRTLPYADPGQPDLRSPSRFLLWIARGQIGVITLATVYGMIWMVAQALIPWAIGRGVDGIAADDTGSAVRWALVIAGLGAVQALVGAVRHRVAVANWLYAAFRTMQVVTRHTARTGPAVPNAMPTGEVVATASSDAPHIGHTFEVVSRFAGSIASYIVVSGIVLGISPPLGLIVLIGVPVLVAATSPLIRPLQNRQRQQREALGHLTALGADTVAGLRVLRGIGGEQVFLGRYAQRSERVRAAGNRLAGTHALLDATLVLLPGIFLVALTWVGARLVLSGTILPGALVAMYGFAFFLVIPVRTAGEMAFATARALVASRRVIAVLTVDRDVHDVPDAPPPASTNSDSDAAAPGEPRTNGKPNAGLPADDLEPDGAPRGMLVDTVTGLRVEPGTLTMLVADDPAVTAAVADRLGRLVPGTGVELGGSPLDHLPLTEVRRRIVVGDPEPALFTGTLRSNLDPHECHDDESLRHVMTVTSGEDILETLREGFDSPVEERGRSLSGGQRQRVALARVLLTDPEILILVEPTSAVDAHTEVAIAERLATMRAGKTTVIATASPLVLAHADTVVWLAAGRVAATGTHHELLDIPGYRYTVTREEEMA